MKIINIDYAGHPFIYELSDKLSKKHIVYHCFADFFFSPKANLINKKKYSLVIFVDCGSNFGFYSLLHWVALGSGRSLTKARTGRSGNYRSG